LQSFILLPIFFDLRLISSYSQFNSPPLATMVTKSSIKPLLVIHGGAGNITRQNLSKESEKIHRAALLKVLEEVHPLLLSGATALDAAAHAVKLLEDNPLFNAGKGAVFTRAGTTELEASIMVSNGYNKRGVGVMLLRHVKNPIMLAREMLLKGDELDGGGAGGHNQISGPSAEELARQWGLDVVDQEYFFTQKRWDEHVRGLKRAHQGSAATHLDEDVTETADPAATYAVEEYLPQGTVGAVALDKYGNIATATSTGGLTNKLPGRIGDTPTLGAGYWAEEWTVTSTSLSSQMEQTLPLGQLTGTTGPASAYTASNIPSPLNGLLTRCIPPIQALFNGQSFTQKPNWEKQSGLPVLKRRAIGISGTGNGDSFLRLNASRTTSALCRYGGLGNIRLHSAMAEIIGRGGEMQRSAGERWGQTGEGEGGMIGIELVEGAGSVVMDLNCGGMCRGRVDADGNFAVAVFHDDES
jgi:L-asparaginase